MIDRTHARLRNRVRTCAVTALGVALALLVMSCEPTQYIVLLRTDMTLSIGDTLQVEAVYGVHGPGFSGHVIANSRDDPEQFRWFSSDTAVARVDHFGTVLAISPGESRISAIHNDIPTDAPIVVRVCSAPMAKNVGAGTCLAGP